MHGDNLLEIALVATTALICGLILRRLRQPVIVGYILAGVVLGPSGFALIENLEAVNVLAELGVLLLLFIIGMEMSLRGFRRVLRLALLGAGAQITIALAVSFLLAPLFDWSQEKAVLIGFLLALSSTAVAIKILEDIGELRTDVGRVAVSILIAQDLAVVPMLLFLNGMAGGGDAVLETTVKLAVAITGLAGMIYFLTRRERVGLAFSSAGRNNPEVNAIIATAYCFGAAVISALLGLSAAYGAFLMGLWIGNSTARGQILQAALPLQGVLLMVLFVSFGLLVDLGFIYDHLAQVFVLVAIVTVAKTGFNVAILRFLGETWPRAWIAGVAIGQIGEFSFVLVAAGLDKGVINPADQKLAVSVIALSLLLSPLWFLTARRLVNLPWRRILTTRQFLNRLYGKEAAAVALVTRSTVEFSLHIGEHSSDLYHRIRDDKDPPKTSDETDSTSKPNGPDEENAIAIVEDADFPEVDADASADADADAKTEPNTPSRND